MTDVYAEADLYTAAFDWPVGAEVDWLLGQLPGVRSVLEPFCGNARYASAFAERDVRYCGFDRSPEMLERATPRAGVELLAADARSFDAPGRPFDLAWCPINSIRHLVDESDLLAHLRCVREHLEPGGRYVIETDLVRHDGPWPHPPDDKSTWTMPQPDGTVVRATWFIDRCDLDARRVWERARIERVDDRDRVMEQIEHTYEMRLCTADDWPRLAADAGFRIERVHEHRADGRPEVTLEPALENTGRNYYVMLVPDDGTD
jgi:SAM-dependent methyltransferase